MIWYVGLPAVIAAAFAALLLTRALLRGERARWLLPYAVIAWSTIQVLLLPSITPDHPWASRRLIPVVLPGVILLATWGFAQGHARMIGSRWRTISGPVAVALLLVPPALTALGTTFQPVERGEVAAVRNLCRAIGPNASVLIVERVTGDRFSQVVRGMCGLPTARVAGNPADFPGEGVPGQRSPGADLADPAHVLRLIMKIRAVGRVPVLLGANPGDVAPYGTPRHVLHLRTKKDGHYLTSPPRSVWSLTFDVWAARA
ncbi:hypothetical protein ACQPYK_20310 [Streptosporangium sp. CA-135522]|uniref:hypothetical protein n=1 Tax=Streptosporangium sp. CA-135522 TaxID=3240072 RepID=UPI003D907135